jgi:hypothetical protein
MKNHTIIHTADGVEGADALNYFAEEAAKGVKRTAKPRTKFPTQKDGMTKEEAEKKTEQSAMTVDWRKPETYPEDAIYVSLYKEEAEESVTQRGRKVITTIQTPLQANKVVTLRRGRALSNGVIDNADYSQVISNGKRVSSLTNLIEQGFTISDIISSIAHGRDFGTRCMLIPLSADELQAEENIRRRAIQAGEARARKAQEASVEREVAFENLGDSVAHLSL